MIDILDHRFASTIQKEIKLQRSADSKILNSEEKQNPNILSMPRFWVKSSDVAKAAPKYHLRGWAFGYMSITSATNARTAVSAILPSAGLGNSITALISPETAYLQAGLAANFACFVFYYVCKQKVSGNNLNYFIVKLLPTIPPNHYSPAHLIFIVPRVLELTYTAWDIVAFADDVWCEADEGLRAARAAIEGQWQANVAATGGGGSSRARVGGTGDGWLPRCALYVG